MARGLGGSRSSSTRLAPNAARPHNHPTDQPTNPLQPPPPSTPPGCLTCARGPSRSPPPSPRWPSPPAAATSSPRSRATPSTSGTWGSCWPPRPPSWRRNWTRVGWGGHWGLGGPGVLRACGGARRRCAAPTAGWPGWPARPARLSPSPQTPSPRPVARPTPHRPPLTPPPPTPLPPQKALTPWTASPPPTAPSTPPTRVARGGSCCAAGLAARAGGSWCTAARTARWGFGAWGGGLAWPGLAQFCGLGRGACVGASLLCGPLLLSFALAAFLGLVPRPAGPRPKNGNKTARAKTAIPPREWDRFRSAIA